MQANKIHKYKNPLLIYRNFTGKIHFSITIVQYTILLKATVERYNKGNDAVMALKQGKIDCVVIDSEPAKKFVEKNDDLEIVEDIFDKEEYAICLSKEMQTLQKSLTRL